MQRIERDQMLMEMAEVVAKRGTCSRAQVGAVFSRDGRIISTGYNGAPSGLPHCDHSDEYFRYELGHQMLEGIDFTVAPGRIMEVPPGSEMQVQVGGCQIAVHAEQNAIAFAAKHGLKLNRSVLHCTHAPCAACARSIINAGIKKVIYRHPYRLTEGVELLNAAGIRVFDMTHNVWYS